ncbi:trans-sialidase, putative, partial [Trypanosoma cruzi marinkellei]
HVTVSNVLLYSRALKNGELETLMKRNAVAAAEAKLPAPEVAAETTHVSEPSRQPATVPVVTNEVQQDATPSPQSQHPPAQTSENTNGSTDSNQTSSDTIGPSASVAVGNVEDKATDGIVLVPASSPTPSVDTREVLATKMPVSGEDSEGGQELFSSNAASPLVGQVGQADGDFPRNDNVDDLAPQIISPDVLESVHNAPSTANTLASEKQDADPEEDTHAYTDVGTNSGPDSLSSTDPATVYRN